MVWASCHEMREVIATTLATPIKLATPQSKDSALQRGRFTRAPSDHLKIHPRLSSASGLASTSGACSGVLSRHIWITLDGIRRCGELRWDVRTWESKLKKRRTTV
jgi:hypothetical protein